MERPDPPSLLTGHSGPGSRSRRIAFFAVTGALLVGILWVFRDFSIIYVLTQGGPIGATQTLAIMTYEQSFGFYKMGYGAAIGVVTLVICLIVARLMVRRTTQALY